MWLSEKYTPVMYSTLDITKTKDTNIYPNFATHYNVFQGTGTISKHYIKQVTT